MVSKWVVEIFPLSGRLLVVQTNPGEEYNAVMVVEKVTPEFVLASDYAALEARCRELEAEVKGLRSAGYSCPTCGNDAVDSVAETFVKPQPMLTTTKCWKCGEGYDITAPTCPHCGAVNANVDPDKASADCLEFQANRGAK